MSRHARLQWVPCSSQRGGAVLRKLPYVYGGLDGLFRLSCHDTGFSSMNKRPDELAAQGRRKFLLKLASASAIVPLGASVSLVALVENNNEEPVTDAVRWGMLIDTSKCASGCDACAGRSSPATNRFTMDKKGRDSGSIIRARGITATDVPALRKPAVCRCLSHRCLV